eukprot:GHVL01005387.1.p1 GENE.GHVL01005387.1~~GHVL01005387.1.p1  ORF type:complete len:347 (-),score=61.92 GHVL01005387.1:50-1090(-)
MAPLATPIFCVNSAGDETTKSTLTIHIEKRSYARRSTNARSPALFSKLCSVDDLDDRVVKFTPKNALKNPSITITPNSPRKSKLDVPMASPFVASPDLSTVCGSDIASPLEDLPTDSPTPFDSEDARTGLQIVEEGYTKTLKWVDDIGWKKCGTKQGVICERKDLKDEPALCRGTVYFSADWEPEFIVDWLWKCENIVRFDTSLEQVFRNKTFSDDWPGLCVYFQSFKGQFGFPGREFLLVGGRKKIANDHYMSMARSCNMDHLLDTSLIKLKSAVRANLMLCGMDCRRMSDGRVRLSIISQVDVNEKWAPEWILNHIYIEQLTKLSKIQSVISKDVKNRRSSCTF